MEIGDDETTGAADLQHRKRRRSCRNSAVIRDREALQLCAIPVKPVFRPDIDSRTVIPAHCIHNSSASI